MKFEQRATQNPIDRGRVVGLPLDRIDGPAKVSGAARYAYEHHQAAPNAAYGWILGASIPKGRIATIDTSEAESAEGVLAVITHKNSGALGKGEKNTATLLGGPKIEHYHQAVACVVAETLEQARDAAHLIRIRYTAEKGRYDLAEQKEQAAEPPPIQGKMPADTAVGDFAASFANAPVKIDHTYTTPDQSHMPMEPFATTAAWSGDKLTLWTANQMVAWGVKDLALTLKIKPENIRLMSPYVGGGFGSKLFLRADAVLAALGAKAAGRPVKVAMARDLMANNSVHRPATIQRIRIGADREGKISAIGHEVWSGNLQGGAPEAAALQTRLLYAGDHRMTSHRLAVLDLPEGNAMRAPGEAVGMLALEVAMDELAEQLRMDPIELRLRNDIQHNPETGEENPYSTRQLVECLREGATRFGWDRRSAQTGARRDGQWLIGMGVAAAFRNSPVMKSAAKVSVDMMGRVTVHTDMTDIGTGSYTIIAQTAAEMLGVPIDRVTVKLGDSTFPVSAGSGGQWGANSSTSGVYAACMALREKLTQNAGFNAQDDIVFEDGQIKSSGRSVSLAKAAGPKGAEAEDAIEFGEINKKFVQAAFGAHFVEAAVEAYTGEIRVRRMLGVFAAGRVLNPKTARSQMIGAMTMGVGAALMEELVVDTQQGFFANHDLAEYAVPVSADIPDQDVVFLDEIDDTSSPMKAKGLGELGICGAGAAISNAVYNATGIRIRDYPLTIDKLIGAGTASL
ncbi:xanthine dehydrogenase molybdenum-binding subunit [Variibacter gotjawalensis]|uniref:Xanthine dehydrogenase molybdenum-binding subunit n=1 Tax=Variibacter gotjawalensis TaxID=1333996 RepID=A0A0S3PRQ2_9BRAD|nr:aldehyde oxidoreductase molybdenum-binding subunit PaoC [Variibacter gotjawalensis]NIK48869.1 xanthine dehydrogenase YagR molybdenum-binding subunit [Variibacter gotjawalensis]RZS50727.1 xanthine dehydrogenase YagR molybdenum-binding subunit [Variibacter gotjawalensis]BAT58563.1 xanthine dehydrogenase molybdenum-binding subunit [Variibacter gotjawalensis]